MSVYMKITYYLEKEGFGVRTFCTFFIIITYCRYASRNLVLITVREILTGRSTVDSIRFGNDIVSWMAAVHIMESTVLIGY